MSAVRALVLPTLAGLLAGGAVAFAVASSARTDTDTVVVDGDAREAEVRAEQAPLPLLAAGGTENAALGDLEHRLAALEDTVAATPPDEPPPDPDVERAAVLATHAEAIEAHFRESSDTSWAQTAAASVRGDLETIGTSAQSTYGILDVDCRSTTCLAELEWSTYEAAVSGYPDLLHHTYALNCARRIVLPEPEGGHGEPYRASLLIDCEQARHPIE